MTKSELREAIDDLLDYCRHPIHSLGIGRTLCGVFLGRPWRNLDDDVALVLAMQQLIEQQLASSRHAAGSPRPVTQHPAAHQQDLLLDSALGKSAMMWSLLWAAYVCDMPTVAIGKACNWGTRRVQQLLAEGRHNYVARAIIRTAMQSDQSACAYEHQIDDPGAAFTPPLQAEAQSLIRYLGQDIIANCDARELINQPGCALFDFIAYIQQRSRLNLVAFVDADDVAAQAIITRREQLFEIVRTLPHTLALSSPRPPIGVLCFVYAHGCPDRQLSYIKQQSQILYANPGGAIVISWTIDVASGYIHIHNPIIEVDLRLSVSTNLIFPGLNYLQQLLDQYPG